MIRMVSNKLSKLKKILRELGKFIHANLKRKHQRAQFTELYSITAQYKKKFNRKFVLIHPRGLSKM